MFGTMVVGVFGVGFTVVVFWVVSKAGVVVGATTSGNWYAPVVVPPLAALLVVLVSAGVLIGVTVGSTTGAGAGAGVTGAGGVYAP
jgi:hypothetical protein